MTTSNEHNNAPAVRLSQEQIRALAICLESCRVSISEVQRKLQISFNEANDLCQSLVDAGYATGLALAPSLRATPAPAPAQEVPSDPNGWCQYVAGMVFCWLQMQEGLGLTSYDEDRFVEAIAGIVQRRLWAYTPAHPEPVTLTDEQKTWAVNQLMEQAQVFASAWSLVGGKFDFGNALDEAEQAKTELRSMVIAALRAKGGK